MKKGFIFAGQGQQFLLMGHDLYEADQDVKDLYDTATKILGYDVLCLDEASLQKTLYTQPALYVLGHALDHLLKKEGIFPDVVSGLSLGEYNALTSSGVISFEDGLRLIQKRAHLMHHAFEPFSTAMVACLKTDLQTIEALLEKTQVEVCNINTPSQIVIGGMKQDIETMLPQLKHAKVIAIPLKVSTVSHMSLLCEASDALKEVLRNQRFLTPHVMFVNNIEGVLQHEGFVESLSLHISRPTQMVKVIQTMRQQGVEHFIEVGPKGSISKFIKEICGESVKISNVYDMQTLRSECE